VDLWEAKRRYEGTRYTVEAELTLRGVAGLLGPFLGGFIRRRIVRYVLAPMRRAAESHG
jgi:hypothetical protein